jgi:UDP-glucuronate decarboxylase
VDELIDAFILFMDAPADLTGPINIGNPDEFTIRELAETVIELTGSASRIVALPLPEDDPRQRQPDITKARELLGWTPTIKLREGLRRTIAYFEDLLRKGDPLAATRT